MSKVIKDCIISLGFALWKLASVLRHPDFFARICLIVKKITWYIPFFLIYYCFQDGLTNFYRKDQCKWRQIVNSINSSNRYDEYKDYDFRRGGWQGGTGHFTQVVWKESKELGMGRAKTGDDRLTFVVGRYRPAGNVINFMQDNVFPRRGR